MRLSTYLDKQCIVLFVFRDTTFPGCRVLPIQVQTVKVVLSQKSYGMLDEGLATFTGRDKVGKSTGSLIPSSNGYKRFQGFVVGFQSIELGVAA